MKKRRRRRIKRVKRDGRGKRPRLRRKVDSKEKPRLLDCANGISERELLYFSTPVRSATGCWACSHLWDLGLNKCMDKWSRNRDWKRWGASRADKLSFY